MGINWEDVVKTVGSNVGVLGVVAWLIRAAISQSLVLQTEKFKMKLKAEADIEIERLKSALQMTAVEHQVRFANLHEKRAEVIAEIYVRALDAYQEGEKFVLNGAYTSDNKEQQESLSVTTKGSWNFTFLLKRTEFTYLSRPVLGSRPL